MKLGQVASELGIAIPLFDLYFAFAILSNMADMKRYQLVETPGKAIVYKLKEEFEADEPSHYACPRCFDSDDKRSILQVNYGRILVCNRCSHTYYLRGPWGMANG